jgi:prolyl oligopeptidase
MKLPLLFLLMLAPPAAYGATPDDSDRFEWLEPMDSPQALDWVKARDAETNQALTRSPAFVKLKAAVLEVLDSDARIPTVTRMGPYLYNFWRDQQHPRGLWRRAMLDEYRKDKPSWTVLIDIDALNRAEKANWVWHGAQCMKPDYRHCLVRLSRGGTDAEVVREYDLEKRGFVTRGFALPEAKSRVSWRDQGTLFVGTDFGPGTMTRAGYPRTCRLWQRGTSLTTARLVYAGRLDDVSVQCYRDRTPGFERDFVERNIDRYHSELYLLGRDGSLSLVDVPTDAATDVEREWLLVRTRSPWTIDGTTHPAGALLAARFDDWLRGKRELIELFRPGASTSLSDWSWTRHHLILNELDDVVGKAEVLTPTATGPWTRAPLAGAAALSALEARAGDPDGSDEYFVTVESYLRPASLERGVLGQGTPETLKRAPSFFEESRYTVERRFATSKDGTRVPYFVVSAKNLVGDGKRPTLLTGYGGFEIALDPSYSGIVGRGWLDRGGVYVVANIRGGGEYGPRWHLAAIREKRLRAYEDFAAVAQALIATKITSPEHLGVMGGSNGGLLAGNMLTLFPRLFGAIVSMVPLLDMKRYTHISAGASWIAEFGDPDVPSDWEFLKTFSPYQNVKPGMKYPPVLFTTATQDDRVGPGHARKMAAKMLELGDDVHFYENVEGGHGMAADNDERAFMNALAYTFLWQHLQ